MSAHATPADDVTADATTADDVTVDGTMAHLTVGRVAAVALLGLPVVILAISGWRNRWMADDGLINVRVIEQIGAGNGPVFNAGERVEAATSPLWVWLVAGSKVLVGTWVRTEWLAVGSGWLLATFGLAAAELGGVRLIDRGHSPGVLVPAGALVVAVLPPFADFATSGLENGLAMAWMGGCWWALSVRCRRLVDGTELSPLQSWGVLVLVGLGPLIRPDLGVFSAAFLAAWLVLSGGTWRRRVAAVGVALALPVGYQIFRMGYYGATVPNTALAKEAASSWWSRGWFYVGDLVTRYELWWPALVLVVMIVMIPVSRLGRGREHPVREWWPAPAGAARRAGLFRALVVGAAVLSMLYIARVGGDFMHARLLLPALFGATLPVTVVMVGGLPRWATAVQLGALAILVLWVASALWPRDPIDAEYTKSTGIADERQIWVQQTHHDHPIVIEDFAEIPAYGVAVGMRQRRARGDNVFLSVTEELRARPSAPGWGTVIESQTDGVIGVAAGTEVNLADIFGLGEPLVARLELPAERQRPGHEKRVPSPYLIARYAMPDPSDGAEVVAARAALACGDLADVNAAVNDPMSVGRFFQNVVNAPRLTGVRVPRDPTRAREKFCRPSGTA